MGVTRAGTTCRQRRSTNLGLGRWCSLGDNATRAVGHGIRRFNSDVMKYLVRVGTARQMETFASEWEPKSKEAAAQARQEAIDAGKCAIDSGVDLLELMRAELGHTGHKT